MTAFRYTKTAFVPGLALALAATFFGIAIYISIAEQPARLALADASLLAQWKMSFKVGIALQGPLAIMAGLAGLRYGGSRATGAGWLAG